MGIFEELRNDVEGALLLTDWLGDGGEPVCEHLAHYRACACLSGNDGKPCPHNIEPDWWERNLKEPIAETIRAELQLKHRIGLTVPVEDRLWMCEHCGCCLKLKVFTPIKHIKAHTKPEVLAKYPSWCWQKKEIEGA